MLSGDSGDLFHECEEPMNIFGHLIILVAFKDFVFTSLPGHHVKVKFLSIEIVNKIYRCRACNKHRLLIGAWSTSYLKLSNAQVSIKNLTILRLYT